MRQLVIFLFFILCAKVGYGQYLLGLDEVGVREKAKIFGGDTAITFNKTWYKDRAYALNWWDDQIECKVMVAFNPYTDLSVATTLTPKDTFVMDALIMSFEEQKFKKGNGWWMAKIANKVLKIELISNRGERSLVFREITPSEL
jgi:hypothetical protein